MNIYCVYLTTYSGNKLPPFYIGSTSIKKIQSGYRGSVCSREFKTIWNKEIKENPQLFKTFIIHETNNRKQATEKERYFHLKFKVNTSSMYVNKNIACVNGIFGVSLTGKQNPRYKNPHSIETLEKIKANRKPYKHSEEHKNKLSEMMTGEGNPMHKKNHTEEAKKKISIAASNRKYDKIECIHCSKFISSNNIDTHQTTCSKNPNKTQKFKHKNPRSEEVRQNLSTLRKAEKFICPHCGIITNRINAYRWHFDNCKRKN